MWIERIEVPLKHICDKKDHSTSPDDCHIALPEDVSLWAKRMRKACEDPSIGIIFSSTSMPGNTAIVIGSTEGSGSAFAQLSESDTVFGLIVDIKILKELQAAIAAAIIAAEC